MKQAYDAINRTGHTASTMRRDDRYALTFSIGFPLLGLVTSLVMLWKYEDGVLLGHCEKYLFSETCPDILTFYHMRDLSLYCLTGTVCLAALFYLAAKAAGKSSSRVAATFVVLVRVAIVGTIVLVLADAQLLTFAIRSIMSFFPSFSTQTNQFIAVVNLGAIAAGIVLLRNIFHFSKPVINYQQGLPLDPRRDRDLLETIGSIAKHMNAKPPDHILIGFDANFYATGAAVITLGQSKVFSGETLYISAPLLRLLTRQEAVAVLSHELGHFVGRDTVYSLRFLPIYRQLQRTLDGLGDVKSIGDAAKIPALTFLAMLMNIFTATERRISREREFEADRKAAAITGPEPLISALIKVSLFSGYWMQIRRVVAESITRGAMFPNLCAVYIDALQKDVVENEKKLAIALADSERVRLSHPTDSHPTNFERAENLKVDIAAVARRIFDMRSHLGAVDEPLLTGRFEEELTAYEYAVNAAVAKARANAQSQKAAVVKN
jgi:Zn-dependent protease with chaperone function